jgi:hypothetical protein
MSVNYDTILLSQTVKLVVYLKTRFQQLDYIAWMLG